MIWCIGGVPTASYQVVLRSFIEASQQMSRGDFRLVWWNASVPNSCSRSWSQRDEAWLFAALPLVFTPRGRGSKRLTMLQIYAWDIGLFWLVKIDIPDRNLLEKNGINSLSFFFVLLLKSKTSEKKMFGYVRSWYPSRTNILHVIRKRESRVLWDLCGLSKPIHFKVVWSVHCARGRSVIYCTVAASMAWSK